MVIGGLTLEIIGLFTSFEIGMVGGIAALTGLLIALIQTVTDIQSMRLNRLEEQLEVEWSEEETIQALKDENHYHLAKIVGQED